MNLVQAFRIVLTTPRLRVLAVRPLLWSLALYVVMWVVAWVGLSWLVVRWTGAEGSLAIVATLVSGALALVAATWLAGYLFVAVLGVVSSFLWDAISRHVDAPEAREPLSTVRLVGDGAARLMLAGVVTVGVLAWSLLSGGSFLPTFLGAAVLGLLDFTAPAFLSRGVTLGRQVGLLPCLAWEAIWLALAVGALAMLPLLAALLAPVLVIAGTLSVAAIPQERLP
ncbi:MAG: EI24 domain-containing protein [Fimbriimonadia bacterium]